MVPTRSAAPTATLSMLETSADRLARSLATLDDGPAAELRADLVP